MRNENKLGTNTARGTLSTRWNGSMCCSGERPRVLTKQRGAQADDKHPTSNSGEKEGMWWKGVFRGLNSSVKLSEVPVDPDYYIILHTFLYVQTIS